MGSFRSDLPGASGIPGLFRARLFNRYLLAGVRSRGPIGPRVGPARDSSRVRSSGKSFYRWGDSLTAQIVADVTLESPRRCLFCCAGRVRDSEAMASCVQCFRRNIFSIQQSSMQAGRLDLLFQPSAGAMGNLERDQLLSWVWGTTWRRGDAVPVCFDP